MSVILIYVPLFLILRLLKTSWMFYHLEGYRPQTPGLLSGGGVIEGRVIHLCSWREMSSCRTRMYVGWEINESSEPRTFQVMITQGSVYSVRILIVLSIEDISQVTNLITEKALLSPNPIYQVLMWGRWCWLMNVHVLRTSQWCHKTQVWPGARKGHDA